MTKRLNGHLSLFFSKKSHFNLNRVHIKININYKLKVSIGYAISTQVFS